MTEIDLVTGILGSGKTTFIREYAQFLIRQGKHIAILENDFGAVNVDMMLLRDLSCDNCRLEMIAGCGDPTCHQRRFKSKLIALGMERFDRIIMEPSGIFDMDEFFDTLYESPLDNWFRVGSIITVTDCGLEDKLSDQMEYLLASESAHCGKLVVSKTGGMTAEENDMNAAKLLSHINSALESVSCSRKFTSADMITKPWDELTDEDFTQIMNCGYRGAGYVKKYSVSDINSMTRYFMNICLPDGKLDEVISGILSDTDCGVIHRLKGFTQKEDGSWLKINSVGGKTEKSPIGEGQSVFIIIGEKLDKERIDSHFTRYNTASDYMSI